MQIIGSGRFSHSISAEELSKGLRKTEKTSKNSIGLITCYGMVGREGVLQALKSFSRTETTITGTFPYPQLFVTINFNIICTETKIYEEEDGSFVEKFEAYPGSAWDLVDFHDFLYLSNGRQAIVRDPLTHTYSENADLPTAMAMCNYNGQVIIGSPDAGYR